MQLTLTISDAAALRMFDALSARYGYTGFDADGITPQTKQQFVRRVVIAWMKDETLAHEQAVAAAAARAAVTAIEV
jgi:hypothetical protein